jgi:hypothetical protein
MKTGHATVDAAPGAHAAEPSPIRATSRPLTASSVWGPREGERLPEGVVDAVGVLEAVVEGEAVAVCVAPDAEADGDAVMDTCVCEDDAVCEGELLAEGVSVDDAVSDGVVDRDGVIVGVMLGVGGTGGTMTARYIVVDGAAIICVQPLIRSPGLAGSTA